MKNIFLILSILLFSGTICSLNAQSYHLELTVANQPDNPISFGWMQGDDFNLIDSAQIDKTNEKVTFSFPINAHPGTYRIILGKTAYAKIMDEAPQQLDLIFNNENIVVETNFKSPVESINIIESEENKVWFGFLLKDNVFQRDIKSYEQIVNRYWASGNEEKAIDAAGQYNQLQLERDVFVKDVVDQNMGLLASVYIKNQRQPLLDGYLSETERDDFYRKTFLRNIDFTDDRLINSSVYSDIIFEYLSHYNNPEFTKEQRENEYIKAVDLLFPLINKNEKVYQFLASYMVNGFKILQMNRVISHIQANYTY
ncbi:MAG: hypothetical protein JXR61_12525 [Prolixibacteraceae bacterium]|nr:hypothetical protein [Prolixibacteraceae bacterium]